MSRDRSYRRRQVARAKRRARRALTNSLLDPPDHTPRVIGIWAQMRKACSYWMCGNPRRYFGEMTRQEVKQLQGDSAPCRRDD